LAGATAARSIPGIEQFEAGISAYAADFGTRAAERLRSRFERLVEREGRDAATRCR
jgi:hypothetical protein